jgi:hypothetical protein
MSTSTLIENENYIVFNSAKNFQDYLRELNYMPLGFNRKPIDSHVSVMTVSVLKLGVTRNINVVRTSAFGKTNALYILDGQHLTKAILGLTPKQLKGFFAVTIYDIDEISDIITTVALINSTAANWKLEDYLNAWVAEGKKDYILLKETLSSFKQNINSVIEAYTMQISTGNKEFKEGNFKAIRKNFEIIRKLHNAGLKAGLNHKQSTFKAMVRLRIERPNISEKDVIETVKNNPAFGFSSDRKGYIDLFREHLNIKV